MHDFDFAAQVYRVTEADRPPALDLPLERNAMFLDAMRDFLALAFRGRDFGQPADAAAGPLSWVRPAGGRRLGEAGVHRQILTKEIP
jgi:hypothetical protein